MKNNTRKSHIEWSSARLATLRLALSQGVGPCRYAQLRAEFGDPEAALSGLHEMRRKDVRIATENAVDAAIDAANAFGAEIVLQDDAAYPSRLKEIARPPIALYAVGDLGRLDERLVAIVGARNASSAAKRFAESLAEDLSSAGVGVVSGLARGVDGAAHKGSLGGFPVGVVAGGIDVVYPREHAKLQAAIAEAGVLLAESPMGAKPTERHFPKRNRIVAGLSVAVVVIEAAERSGSLITARFALEEGREVLATPGFPTDPRSAGANRLIRDGATLVRSADDVLAALPQNEPAPRPKRKPRPARQSPAMDAAPAAAVEPAEPSGEAAPADRVRAALAAAPTTVDELTRECQLSASTVAAILQELELGGELERLPGQRVSLR